MLVLEVPNTIEQGELHHWSLQYWSLLLLLDTGLVLSCILVVVMFFLYRVNELRERLRDGCRHKDDYFDEQQWISLPGLPQEYNPNSSNQKSYGNHCCQNNQTLSIAPLICRSIISCRHDSSAVTSARLFHKWKSWWQSFRTRRMANGRNGDYKRAGILTAF